MNGAELQRQLNQRKQELNPNKKIYSLLPVQDNEIQILLKEFVTACGVQCHHQTLFCVIFLIY